MHPTKRTSRLTCTNRFEQEIRSQGYSRIAGLDEAGRGALCGPVVAAAVILNPSFIPVGIDDSKKLSPGKRETLFKEIYETAVGISVGQVDAEAIDQQDILKATRQAMAQAVAALNPAADFLLIDALLLQAVPLPQKPIIQGDAQSVSIAAASIVAKVTRDRLMLEFDRLYPQYGFRRHKGYGTAEHLHLLRQYGPSPIHRRTFRPIYQLIIPFAKDDPFSRT